ncbi:hypothetical protein AB0D57_03310 [Streptomyces sp. NPDC048275]
MTVQVNGAAQPLPCRIVLLTPASSTDNLDAVTVHPHLKCSH